MKGFTAFTVLALASSAVAFAPSAPAFTRVATPLNAEAKELVLDTKFEDVNVVKLLGLKRVKKIARKNKRKKNKEE
jgi:hypothetical protein